MSYDEAWRNRGFRVAPYEQYCFPEELETWQPKLLKIIEKHGSAFDDNWQYKKRGKTRKVIVRVPIWLGKKFFFRECEKIHHFAPREDPKQKKLLACVGESKTP